jgi:hypothetical protein
MNASSAAQCTCGERKRAAVAVAIECFQNPQVQPLGAEGVEGADRDQHALHIGEAEDAHGFGDGATRREKPKNAELATRRILAEIAGS